MDCPRELGLLIRARYPIISLRPNQDIRIALAYLEWGAAAYAVGALEAVVVAEPDLPFAWKLLGDAYRQEGRGRQAMASYRRAVELAPQFQSALQALTWRARVEDYWRRLRDVIVSQVETR